MQVGDRIIISKCRIFISYFVFLLLLALLLAVIVAEIAGKGIIAGIYYRAFGPIVYVVFYSGIAFILYKLAKIILSPYKSVFFEEDFLYIPGRAPLHISEIQGIEIEKRGFSRYLRIQAINGRDEYIAAKFLCEELKIVEARMRRVLREENRRTGEYG